MTVHDDAPAIRSQEDMCRHFLPILHQKGTIVHKMGKRMARPARKGEEVLTVINSEVVAKTIVADESSMVIRQESADHELYCLSAEKFALNYSERGEELIEPEPSFEELRQRGFKYYERRGGALLYQVTEEDMEFVPGGQFEVSFSSFPQPLRAGDYLVTSYPGAKEIYMSRHATIYNDGLLFTAPGIRSQEEMSKYFLPILLEKGMKVRRAGVRLCRPASKGEEVATIINGEVVAKMRVLDDTSMVIQEQSLDREIYCLDGQTFSTSYEQPGREILDQGPDFDALRERGFKYYDKTAGMVCIYQVTAEDMEFVPSGKFQVDFSNLPQPLRVGDYLVMNYPDGKDVYMCRNAEQVYLSQNNLVVHYIFGSPITFPPLKISSELDGLRTSGAIVRLTCATRDNLMSLKRAWETLAMTVLHVSCHTCMTDAKEFKIVLEHSDGRENLVAPQAFAELMIGGGTVPSVVVLNCCSSAAAAAAFLDKGVRYVVTIRNGETLLDRAARDFTFSFYGELRAHRGVEAAFEHALESMKASVDKLVPSEAAKFVLHQPGVELHRGTMSFSTLGANLEPHIAVRVPFGVPEAEVVGPLIHPHKVTQLAGPIPQSRVNFLFGLLGGFASCRVIKVCGSPGAGKKTLARALGEFAAMPGGRFFSGGALVVQPSLDTGIPTQEQMREYFTPILNKRGTLVKKVGSLMARHAKKGEIVRTVIDGEVVATNVVADDTSMVIRHDSTDNEMYANTWAKFSKNYKAHEPLEITEEGAEFDALRDRGFRYYERTGMALICRVSREDMRYVPEGKFWATHSSIPVPLKVGDYLAIGYPSPSGGEVYLSRNAEQIYLSKIVRSNKEMHTHFAPVLSRRGTIARRVGRWLARPARTGEVVLTVMDGEVVGRTVVSEEGSMVVCAESAERECYVLDRRQFLNSYRQPGADIRDQCADSESRREQGFKWYERRGLVRIYQVTQADMEFVPNRQFWGCGGNIPQNLNVGDYLVTGYPDVKEVYVSRNAEQVFAPAEPAEIIRSQADMHEHFVPILMSKGIQMRACGKNPARPAVRGEKIRTIVDGQMVAKMVVEDHASMVVQQASVDRELYVCSKQAFSRSHEIPGADITENGREFDTLRERGFEWYVRKDVVLVYQVTLDDMEFVPGGKFHVSFSTIPQPLRAGDYLVANYPHLEEVYLNRNAMQIYTPTEQERLPNLLVTPSPGDALADLALSGSPARWLKHDWRKSDTDSLGVSEADLPDDGLRKLNDLQSAISAGATKLAARACQWYPSTEDSIASSKAHGQASEAEVGVESWLRAVPVRSRALLVLLDGAKYLSNSATRELLKRLLRTHTSLHLLVTVTNKADVCGPPLDASITEHHRVVPLPELSPREAAEVLHSALVRRQQSRLWGHANTEEAIAMLMRHPAIADCQRRPGALLQRAARVDDNTRSLDEL